MVHLTITIEDSALKKLEARAKKNLMTKEEMASDIVRRSMVSYKGKTSTDAKIDDEFVKIFSRKKS